MRSAAAAVAIASLAACGSMRKEEPPPTPPPMMVELENAATGTPIRVGKGGEIKLLFDSMPSTGFQWQGPPIVKPTLSPLGSRAFAPKAADPRNIGAGGYDIFRYRAEQPGKITLRYEYRRVWETLPPAKSVTFEVTVE